MVAALAAFVILFLNKTGLRTKIRDFFDVKEVNLFADLLDCDFCLSFWLCFCIAFGLIVLGYELSYIIAAVCATPISRFLL